MSQFLIGQIILNNADEVSEGTAAAWNELWELGLSGALYNALNNIGIMLAVASALFWCFGWMKAMHTNDSKSFTELIWPLIVVLLLVNNGAILRSGTLGMRNVINVVNTTMLETINSQIDFERSLAELANFSSAQAEIANLRAQCDSITENSRLQVCIEQQRVRAEEILRRYQSEFPGGAFAANLSAFVVNNFSSVNAIASGAGRVMLSAPMLVVEAVMIAMQVAFQSILEVSMLLTGLMGPVAVGTTLLPIGAKPIYAWLSGFWALGLAKLSLNIVTGLVAVSIAQAGGITTMGSSIALGLLSPLLALGVAGFGGMALFNGICHATMAPARMIPVVGDIFK